MQIAKLMDYGIFSVLFIGFTIWFSLIRIWRLQGYSPDGVVAGGQMIEAIVDGAAKALLVALLTALLLYLVFVLAVAILT